MTEFVDDVIVVSDGSYQPRVNEVAQTYLTDLEQERGRLGNDFPIINVLIDEDINRNTDGTYQPRVNEIAQNFLADLEKERSRLGEDMPLINVLIEEAIERIYSTGRIPGKEFYADVYKQKPIKITQKVFVPVKQYPKV